MTEATTLVKKTYYNWNPRFMSQRDQLFILHLPSIKQSVWKELVYSEWMMNPPPSSQCHPSSFWKSCGFSVFSEQSLFLVLLCCSLIVISYTCSIFSRFTIYIQIMRGLYHISYYNNHYRLCALSVLVFCSFACLVLK